jgi:hypothetical protein
MHPPSTIRSSIGSMAFRTASTRFNRREINGVCMHIPISHHLSTQPPQHTTMQPIGLSAQTNHTHTHLLHHPLKQSIQNYRYGLARWLYHMACLGDYFVRRVCKATRHGIPEITTCSVRKTCKATQQATWLGECARQLGMACPKSPPAWL